MSQMGKGELKMIGMPMAELVQMLQKLVAAPIVDETHLSGTFDVHLAYDPTHPESILETLRKHGFEVRQRNRPIEFLIVSRK